MSNILLQKNSLYQHLHTVFKRLQENGITINLEKCDFLKSEIDFLGYHITSQGIRPTEKKPSSNDTPRRIRQIDFISQYCTNIQHISGRDNIAADALSRIEQIDTPSPINYVDLSKCQSNDQELIRLRDNKSLKSWTKE